ncbi:MAG: M24 family metallopeptidase, partial [Proteobacteria bacterium]
KIGRIVANCLQVMGKALEPGMTTRELDQIGSKFLEFHGARSAPQLTYNFPGATCISVNEEAAHGIPGDKKLQASDLVNIDVSAEMNGYFADTGGSFIIPPESDFKDKRVLKENQVITIEPFLSTGARQVFDVGDGWTLATSKRYLTAQYEHTMVITKGRPLIMTLPA